MMKDFTREHEANLSGESAVTFVNAIGRKPVAPKGYRAWGKRALDVSLVTLSLPVVLPVVAMCALALWVESGAPFYSQDRLGLMGRRFRIFKLRTMVRNADEMLERCLEADPALRAEWNETQKLKNDPRITRVGALLRKTSLDELPQLLNVLRGDMSLVGPRPMMPEQLPLYGDPSAYFALRPGLTGSWQISARNTQSFATRAVFDASYLGALSLRRDVAIICRTFGVVMKRTGY
jgi:lipopolysaccharide/colanic/teichoic acid biosynthesis glycosyltransferase